MYRNNSQGVQVSVEELRAFIDRITPDMVLYTYSGRAGCACGCRGTYKYNPAHQDEASAQRGYRVTNEELSRVAVQRGVTRIQCAPAGDVEMLDGHLLSLDLPNGRTFVLRLRPALALGGPTTA